MTPLASIVGCTFELVENCVRNGRTHRQDRQPCASLDGYAVKQPNQGPAFLVNPTQVRTFVQIAVVTCEREIFIVDRGRDKGELCPSLRTGLADLLHPALQLVVNFQEDRQAAAYACLKENKPTAEK